MKEVSFYLDQIFRIVKHTYVDLEAIQFMYRLLVKKDVDLSPFTAIERDYINECHAWPITIGAIFETFFRNNSIVSNKKYAKYYMNKRLSEYIVQKSALNGDESILDGNVLINGYLNYITNANVTGYQTQPLIQNILNPAKPLKQNDLIFEQRDRKDIQIYDRIFFNIPSDVHNITHASCAEYIKKLKIRGTSYEAVCLQMISLLLARKGIAFITISDTFLLRDTVQIVQTRKYLLDHYNIKEIIKIDDGFNPVKDTIHSSILILEEGSKTEEILFSTVKFNEAAEDNIVQTNSLLIPVDTIKQNNYVLAYHAYKNSKTKYENEDMKAFKDIFEISEMEDPDKAYIYIDKNNKTTDVKAESKYIISAKNHPVYLHYLKHYLHNNVVDYIDKIVLPVIPENFANLMMKHINALSEHNDLKQKLYQNGVMLKKNLLELYMGHSTQVSLSSKCDISDQQNQNAIGVMFNTANVGAVVYHPDESLKSYWWLTMKSANTSSCKFVYYYIWYNFTHLHELAQMKAQNHLSQSNILNLKIPCVPLEIQQLIIQKCDGYTYPNPPAKNDDEIDFLFNFNSALTQAHTSPPVAVLHP